MALATLGLAAACVSDPFDEMESLDLRRCLEPMNLNAKVSASLGDVVTFSWDVSKDAESYLLAIFNDSGLSDQYETMEVLPTEVPKAVKLPADRSFYFQVQARNSTKEDSRWAVYDKAVKTFAVKDPLYLKVADRQTNSVTVRWSDEVEDYTELTDIVWCPAGAEGVQTRSLTQDEIASACATITGLAPSTEYEVSIFFASASRGEVDVWTMPDVSSAVPVSTSAALEQGMKDGATILLKMEGSPYSIGGGLDGGFDTSKGFKLLGESAADGTRPVIVGAVSLTADFTGDIWFEGVDFSGNNGAVGHPICLKNGGTGSLVPVGGIVYKNCGIYGYSKGLIYEWNQTFKLGELTWDSCDIHDINSDGSGGGDVIDFRGASEVSELNIVNNTICQGMRTFVRIDAGTWGNVRFENNTLMNLCFVDNTNNAGIFGLQVVPASFSFKNNLFLNMVEKSTLTGANDKYKSADDLAVSASNNWFYNVYDGFFTAKFPYSKAAGATLSADPCYNAKGGYFNILQDSDIAGRNVGAPKWFVPFVEEPEDLTLNALEGAHVWDFGNAKYFSGTSKKFMVRDQLLVTGAESFPIAFADGAVDFAEATVCNRKGLPQYGYLCFKVTEPGSVVLKAEGETAAHLIVATSAVESPASVSVKGGVSPMASGLTPTKIIISDVTEPTLVYVYASGPVTLSQLAWSTDLSPVNTALPAPKPVAKPATFIQGEATDVTVSWEPVENAGGYSVVFSGKTYAVEDGQTSYVIEGKTTAMLDAGSYTVNVFANPGDKDIYNTMSEAGTAAFAVLQKGGGGDDEFIVSSVEDLLNAIAAGKDFITLKYSDTPYAIGALELTAPLHLKGQTSGGRKTPVTLSATLSGEIGGSVVLKNLEFVGDGSSVIIDDKNNAPVADTVAIYDSYLHGTKALYDNSGKAASNVQYVIFKGNLIEDSSDGADYIDLRAGAHHNFIFVSNTVANSCRTFVRTDAAHEMNSALVRNNTFYKVATNANSKDNNGILHIRSTGGSGLYEYKVQNNFFYSILIDTEPGNAAGFPKLRSKAGITPAVVTNNYYYNCEDRQEKAAYSFWSYMTKEEGTAGGGAILPADPCKNAAAGDFTLTNAVMMNANVGDPRWNPMSGGTPTSEITVKNTDELLTAISAGKKTITLAAGDYDFTAASAAEIENGKLTLVGPLNIVGESGAHLIGGFIFKEGATSFSMKGVRLDGASSVDNAFEVADAAVQMTSFALKDCDVTAFKNRLFYMGQTASVTSLEFSGNIVTGADGGDFTSGDFIDIRKGTALALKVRGNTFSNAIRTFARVDAAVIMNSAVIANNTFYNLCYVDSKDNNGILHFRSSSLLEAKALDVSKNIFASMHRAKEAPGNAAGFPKIVSTASEKLGHPAFSGNYYYDIDETEPFSWWNTIGADEPLAGSGVLLGANPFKDAASGDFTLVNALAASENVGDPRWNKSKVGPEGEPFPVASLDELLNAVSAGKNYVKLAAGTYDFTSVDGNPDISGGVWTLKTPLAVLGVSKNGVKPEIVGGFKPAMTEGGFSLEGVRVNGNAAVSNMIDVDASAVMDKLVLKDCEFYGFTSRLVSGSGTSKIGPADLSGLLVHDFGTSGDFFDIRKGSIESVKITNSTFYKGIRTFIRIDAAVECGAVIVRNNTFFNLGSVDSKDNNGILHVRSTSATSSPRQIVVEKNIFASMHRAVEVPTQTAAGFPHLISKASAAIAVPTIKDNLFWDIDATGDFNWWTYLPEDYVTGAGMVLGETPFAGDTASGKFTLKSAFKGYGDLRW